MGKKKYDEAFKQKVVGLYQSGWRQSDLMREFRLAKSLIQQWRREYPVPIDMGHDGELTEVQKENIALRERVRQLEKENEVLKLITDLVEKKK